MWDMLGWNSETPIERTNSLLVISIPVFLFWNEGIYNLSHVYDPVMSMNFNNHEDFQNRM